MFWSSQYVLNYSNLFFLSEIAASFHVVSGRWISHPDSHPERLRLNRRHPSVSVTGPLLNKKPLRSLSKNNIKRCVGKSAIAEITTFTQLAVLKILDFTRRSILAGTRSNDFFAFLAFSSQTPWQSSSGFFLNDLLPC